MAGWIFDEVGPNQYDPGESVLDQIFDSSSSLAKEPLQNAIDRITEASKKDRAQGKIEISLLEFSGEPKAKLLELIEWTTLKQHVEAVASESSKKFSARLQNAHKRINGKDSIFLLIVSDFGTIGLPGDDFERKNHIFKLTRSAHVTDDTEKNRDGSHGLGKGVFWKYSGISTVFFYSLTCQEELGKFKGNHPPIKELERRELDHRFLGNSTLAHHKIDSTRYQQAGFLGETEKKENGTAVVSLWGNNKLVDFLGVKRDEKVENAGTSVIVFDYNDPSYEDEQTGKEIIENIAASCAKWFWPALSAETPSGEKLLDLKLKHYKNGLLKNELEPDLNDFINFIDIFKNTPNESKISQIGEIAGKDVDVLVPLLVDDTNEKKGTDAKISVKVKSVQLSSALSEAEKNLKNTSALLRRKTMVVDYEPIKAKLDEGTCVFGVVAAGLARGRSKEDEALHNFLRDMEPPAHDSWDKYAQKLNVLYRRGSIKMRSNIIKEYRAALTKICAKEVDTKGKKVPALAAMLRFPGLGKPLKNYTINSSNIQLKKLPAEQRIRLRFQLFCNDVPSTDLWRASFFVKVKGTSERLEFSSYTEVGAVTAVVSEEVKKDELFISVHFEERIEYEAEMHWPTYLPISENYAIELITRHIEG